MTEAIKPFCHIAGWYGGYPTIAIHNRAIVPADGMELYDSAAIEQARKEATTDLAREFEQFVNGTHAKVCTELAELRKQLAAAQSREKHTHETLNTLLKLPAGTDVTELLAARERETFEKCLAICELALHSAGTTPADVAYEIRAMMNKEQA
jgi:hypothetical protein